MSRVRPRHTIHRGSVLASGLVIDTRFVPEAYARERILGFAVSGLDVFRIDSFLIACFQDAIRLDCATAQGSPLVRYGKLLSSAPLEADEQKQLQTLDDSVVLIAEGFATTYHVEQAIREDLSLWLDVSEFSMVRHVQSLGEVIGTPKAALVKPVGEVRGSLGIEPLTQDGQMTLQALVEQGRETGEHQPLKTTFSAVFGMLSAFWQWIKSRMQPRGAGGSNNGSQRGDLVVAQDTDIKGDSWLTSLRTVLQHLAARVLVWSRLAPLVGRRHAEYLARMMEMFDQGELDKALRHAIPLSTEVEQALRRPPALRTLSPRTDLAIVPGRSRTSTSLGLGENLFEALRNRYRRAFDRLVALGDIEKAAFVLAELLHENEEAVSFLERHGRLKLAAEIAEARGLPAGLVIRQWFLAGQRARAIRIARQTGAFADAVVRLERSHQEEAQVLRLMWADTLAKAGAYPAAVDAVWPVVDARDLALRWIDRAIEVGGPTGARMLVRKLRIVPDQFAQIRDCIRLLLRAAQEDRRPIAQALADELVSAEMTDETRVVSRMVIRTLLGELEGKRDDRLVQKLLDGCGDAVLRADIMAPASTQSQPSTTAPIFIRAYACTDVGKQRHHNEDTCLAALLDQRSTPQSPMVVDGDGGTAGIVLGAFDGLGGVASGDVASQLAAQTVVDRLRIDFPTYGADSDQWARCLVNAVEQANQAIVQAAAEPSRRGMGSCATVATLYRSTLFVAQIGDTRGYLLRGTDLVQVTQDHSLVHELISVGKLLTDEEIAEFPHKNVITRCLGVSEKVDVDVTRVQLYPGDVILLCSDGLSSLVDHNVLKKTIVEQPTLKTACELLVKKALDEGGTDNITVVLARLEGKRLEPSQRDPIKVDKFVPPMLNGKPVPARGDLQSRIVPLEVHRTAADTGSIAAHDIAQLPDGRLLVALGELGARLLSREGKVLTHFAEPTHHIVMSDHGDRAILVAPRGETFRLARLDLMTKRVQPWCDARLDQFAPDFDGSTWYTSRNNVLYAIDALSMDWEHLWKVDEPNAKIEEIRRDSKALMAWFARSEERGDKKNGEIWVIDLPSHTLRERRSLLKDDLTWWDGSVSVSGVFVGWSMQRSADDQVLMASWVLRHGHWRRLQITIPGFLPIRCVTDDWIVLVAIEEQGTVFRLYDMDRLHQRVQMTLDGAKEFTAVRLQGDHLLVADRCGRVLVFSLTKGVVVREFRLS